MSLIHKSYNILAHHQDELAPLRRQLARAEAERHAKQLRNRERDLQRLASLPLAPLDDQHRPVRGSAAQPPARSLTKEPYLLDDGIPVLRCIGSPIEANVRERVPFNSTERRSAAKPAGQPKRQTTRLQRLIGRLLPKSHGAKLLGIVAVYVAAAGAIVAFYLHYRS